MKYELSSENKAVDCPRTKQKRFAHKDTVPTVVPEYKVETLYLGTGTVAEF